MVIDNIDYKLTPSDLHRCSDTEQSIQKFKNHFVSGLYSTPPSFSLHLWVKLIPQSLLTLNLLLLESRFKPKISAQHHIRGVFNYQRTLLALSGIAFLAHI